MVSYFLCISYVGSNFFGWQIQTSVRSVQKELWIAIRVFDNDSPMPAGTSRTDAGVHAVGQGVLVYLKKEWDSYRLMSAINAHLPWDIRVTMVQKAPNGFFPRSSAVAKRYVYRIQEGKSEDPFLYKRKWHIFGLLPLDKVAIVDAAYLLLGTHDFSSFRHSDCVAVSAIRTIYKIDIKDNMHGFDIIFEGNRFLMHMVRIIVGTLIEVGKNRYKASDVVSILSAKDRRRAGSTAPPHGLYLEKIWYQSHWGIGELSPWPDLKLF